MPYTKTTWIDRVLDGSGNPTVTGTPLSAANLNNIETGIDNATNGLITFPNGSAASPSIAFANSTTTGLYRATTNVIGISTNGTEAVRIDSSGNVGISNTSPSEKIHVKGNVRVEASSTPANNYGRISHNANSTQDYGLTLQHYNGGTKDAEITIGGNSAVGLNNIITLNTNGSERMKINSSGNVGIGTSSPSTLLHVAGSITYTNRPVTSTGTTLVVDANGLIRELTSSQRFKENISPFTKGLEYVNQLNPVTYTYKGEDVLNAGFIAEEVEQIGLDEFVVKDNDGKAYSIPYGNMVALLTKAIQELSQEVNELKARLN